MGLSHLHCDLPHEDSHQALDISIIRKAVHVIFEELAGLPLDPEIEFVIELLSNTTLVSTTSYYVIPTGLNGSNLAERGLFNKSFIRPNHSPLGISVLCVRKGG